MKPYEVAAKYIMEKYNNLSDYPNISNDEKSKNTYDKFVEFIKDI